MIDIESVARQVKHNCTVSDAQFWGYYSPCGLLLRMRDLYRIEHHMHPWEPVETNQMKQWIDDREQLWHELEEGEYQDITVQGQTHDAFDIETINAALSPHGFLYGAGYGNKLKPVFMLAELAGRHALNDVTVYIAGRELARDLSITPAMARQKTVFGRQETMGLYYWDKFVEMAAMKNEGALHRAFREYGISKDDKRDIPSESMKSRFSAMINEEMQTLIHHELGEASQSEEFRTWWKNMLLSIPHSRAEFFVRSVKDILADTCPEGTLAHIVQNKKSGSLAFYVSLFGGFRKVVFTAMVPAYEEFAATGNWAIIENARSEGYEKAHEYSQQLKRMYDNGDLTQETIEEALLPDRI